MMGSLLLLLLAFVGVQHVAGADVILDHIPIKSSDGLYGGYFGTTPVFSSDERHLLVSARQYNSGRGRAYVYSETVLGSQDWHKNEQIIIPTGQGTNDYFGDNGMTWSLNDEHILICARAAGTDNRGRVYVFSETTLGSMDWNANEVLIESSDMMGTWNFLGVSGALITADNTRIVACASGYNGSKGKCFVFYESSAGARDWGDQQVGFAHSDPSASPDGLGNEGIRFSSDERHILTSAYQWGDIQGKIYVFSESVPGNNDWTVQVGFQHSDVVGIQNHLTSFCPAVFSHNDQHVASCASSWDGSKGKCWVWSETTPGSKDWGAIEEPIMILTNPVADMRMGNGGIVFSQDDSKVMTCAWDINDAKGRCYIYSETTIGSMDWGTNEVVFEPIETQTNIAQFGRSGPRWSADEQRILVCAYGHDNYEGKCYVFYETVAGSKDWQDNQIGFLVEPATTTTNSMGLGRDKGIFSADGMRFIVGARFYEDTGALFIFNATYDDCCVDPCVSGTCTDLLHDFNCTCDSGTTGTLCELDIDDCIGDPCAATGFCSDDGSNPHAFNCTCNLGYVGTLCDDDAEGYCAGIVCDNGTCTDSVCVCDEGYEGLSCDIYSDDCTDALACGLKGTCIDDDQAFTCDCDSGVTGLLCDEDIDDCVIGDNPCGDYGDCSDDGRIQNSFNCSCKTNSGFTGTLCDVDIDDCASSPCENGECGDDGSMPHSFTCSCEEGYAGDLCDEIVSPCLSDPCIQGTCVDAGFNFTCQCSPGFTGDFCEIDIDDCASSPCWNNGTCVDGITIFTCSCLPGSVGAYCEIDIDDCLSHPCNGEGTSSCYDIGLELFECKCLDGYTGNWCELEAGVETVDACLSNPCENNSTCTNRNKGGAKCACLTGTTGEFCAEDVDECASSPCSTPGTSSCTDLGINMYECKCNAGFIGDFCEVDSNTEEKITVSVILVDDDTTVETVQEELARELMELYPDKDVTVTVYSYVDETGSTVLTIEVYGLDADQLSPTELEAVVVESTIGAIRVYAADADVTGGSLARTANWSLLMFVLTLGILGIV